mgnify:CR=1 FL=1
MTYRQVINIFDVIAEQHKEIHSFHSGFMDEVDIQKLGLENYPILYVEPSTATIDTGTLMYTFNIFVMDMINDEPGDSDITYATGAHTLRIGRTDSFSELLQVLNDVINDFKQNLHLSDPSENPPVYTSWTGELDGSEIILQLPITTEPFTARFDNELTGWNATISIQVNNTNNRCIAPINNPT